MPFYEYKCSRCAHHHEALQKITDKPLRKCPGCGRATLTRLISAPVFRLKGSGWYETDFKSDKDAKRNLAGEREPVDGKVIGKKGEAKPEAGAKPSAAAAEQPPAKHKSADKPADSAGAKRKTPRGARAKRGRR